LSHRYCYLPLSWKSWKQFECADINKLCNVASCWIYIGILLWAHHILHISRIRVKVYVLWKSIWHMLPTAHNGPNCADAWIVETESVPVTFPYISVYLNNGWDSHNTTLRSVEFCWREYLNLRGSM
jgi:hypothetical protein